MTLVATRRWPTLQGKRSRFPERVAFRAIFAYHHPVIPARDKFTGSMRQRRALVKLSQASIPAGETGALGHETGEGSKRCEKETSMSPADLPNVIVIMADQLKANASHLYGNPFCVTPSLARLAQEGVLFQHAFTPHPLCVPARVSLWTGQYAHTHGCRRNETWMKPDALHAFKIWKEAGYHTALIGKNHCFQEDDYAHTFDTWCEVGHAALGGTPNKGMEWFRPRAGVEAAFSPIKRMNRRRMHLECAVTDGPLEDHSTGLVAGQTVHFLAAHRHEPFALWVSFPCPHEPYLAPRPYAELFPPKRIILPPWEEALLTKAPERNRLLHAMLGVHDDELDALRRVMGVYYGNVRFIDDAVGQILDALACYDLREKTIVVFCSDHGDFMGEHRMTVKGGVFYDCLTRIPLIASWPGRIAAGRVEESLVNLIDVVPTLLALQGLAVPAAMQGQGLPAIIADATPRQAAFSEYGAGGRAFTAADLAQAPRPYGYDTIISSLRWREAEGRRKMVRTRHWKYVHDPMGDLDELYDLVNDPWELHNLAAEPAHRDVLAELRLQLADWSIQTEDARPVPLPPCELT
jgi:arylsulfatase A-like enzyme